MVQNGWLATALATLAVLAIRIDQAEAGVAVTSCSAIPNCRQCLGTTGCAWHTGTEDGYGCVEESYCDANLGTNGECWYGSDDRNGSDTDVGDLNSKTCDTTCSARAHLTVGSSGRQSYTGSCEECLGYRYDDDPGYKTDCAWLVQPGQPPRCVHHDRCDDRQFEEGQCLRSRSDLSNAPSKCAYDKVKDACEKNKGCQQCLKNTKGASCAWFVSNDGKHARGVGKCVAEGRCQPGGDDVYSSDKGTCTSSSTTFFARKTCSRLKNPPTYRDGDEAICSALNGLCTECLTADGCQWNNEELKCVDDRDDSSQRGRRFLALDETQANAQCARHKLTKTNEELCLEAVESVDDDDDGQDACDACVRTQLYVLTGEFHVVPPTCKYINGACVPSSHEHENGSTCGHWNRDESGDLVYDPGMAPPPAYQPLPRDGESWPDLLNTNVDVAISNLDATYGPGKLQYEIIPPADVSTITKDVRPNRVRFFVDEPTEKIIIREPETG